MVTSDYSNVLASLLFVADDICIYRSHVTFLELPSFGGVDEGSSDRPHSQTVAAVLSASEMLLGEGTGRST